MSNIKAYSSSIPERQSLIEHVTIDIKRTSPFEKTPTVTACEIFKYLSVGDFYKTCTTSKSSQQLGNECASLFLKELPIDSKELQLKFKTIDDRQKLQRLHLEPVGSVPFGAVPFTLLGFTIISFSEFQALDLLSGMNPFIYLGSGGLAGMALCNGIPYAKYYGQKAYLNIRETLSPPPSLWAQLHDPKKSPMTRLQIYFRFH